MTRFWVDPWVYDAKQARILFALCENKEISVAQALQGRTYFFQKMVTF